MNNRLFFGIFAFCALALVVYLFKPFLLDIFIAALLAVAVANVQIAFLTLTKTAKRSRQDLRHLRFFAYLSRHFLRSRRDREIRSWL